MLSPLLGLCKIKVFLHEEIFFKLLFFIYFSQNLKCFINQRQSATNMRMPSKKKQQKNPIPNKWENKPVKRLDMQCSLFIAAHSTQTISVNFTKLFSENSKVRGTKATYEAC